MNPFEDESGQPNESGKALLEFLGRHYRASPFPSTTPANLTTNICFWCRGAIVLDSGRGFVHSDTMMHNCPPPNEWHTALGTAGHQTPGENPRYDK